MLDQLISFETAKLAKEKGFDVEVRHYYNVVNNEISLYPGIFKNHNTKRLLRTETISAPTQSLLQKWLREKHNVFIILSPIFNQNQENIFHYATVYLKNIPKCIDFHGNTYEEALEEGLKEGLKLI